MKLKAILSWVMIVMMLAGGVFAAEKKTDLDKKDKSAKKEKKLKKAKADNKTEPAKKKEVSHFSGAVRGGYFMPEDEDYMRFYGRWSNDVYFFELGWNFFNNFYLLGSVGGYYQRGFTLGEKTGEESGEDLTWTSVYLDGGASYRLRWKSDQLIVPFISGSYVSLYYHEDKDPGDVIDGWKSGVAGWGGVLILLDRIDPQAAWHIRSYHVENTYLELSGRYNKIGDSNGIDMSGWMGLIGISMDF